MDDWWWEYIEIDHTKQDQSCGTQLATKKNFQLVVGSEAILANQSASCLDKNTVQKGFVGFNTGSFGDVSYFMLRQPKLL